MLGGHGVIQAGDVGVLDEDNGLRPRVAGQTGSWGCSRNMYR